MRARFRVPFHRSGRRLFHFSAFRATKGALDGSGHKWLSAVARLALRDIVVYPDRMTVSVHAAREGGASV